MANRWLQHLAQYRKLNKDMNPKDLMKNARKSYQNGGGVFKAIGNTVKSVGNTVKTVSHDTAKTVNSAAKSVNHDVKSSVNKLKGGGESDVPTPYVKSPMGSPVQGAMDVIGMRGGEVVPYETTGTESTPAKVGGRRSRRQSKRKSSRKSRRTRRR
jgi:hypothetical protein